MQFIVNNKGRATVVQHMVVALCFCWLIKLPRDLFDTTIGESWYRKDLHMTWQLGGFQRHCNTTPFDRGTECSYMLQSFTGIWI